MMELWKFAYFLLFLVTLVYAFVLNRREGSKSSFWHLNFLAGLPLLAGWLGSQPFLPLLAYQVQVFLLVAHWSRQANRDQAESLTKFVLSVSLGNFFILSHWLIVHAKVAFVTWPLSVFLTPAEASFAYEAIAAACAGVGLFLVLGLPPLQQGWLDLAETQTAVEQFRTQVQLRLSLIFSVWAYVPYILTGLTAPVLELLACFGLIALAVCRLASSVQMSVMRTLAYQATSFYFVFWLALGLPASFSKSGHGLLVSVLWLFPWVYVVAWMSSFVQSLPSFIAHPQWDDPELPPGFFNSLRRLQILDGIQSIFAAFLAYRSHSYTVLIAAVFYMLCSLSTFLDKDAFRRRSA